MVIETLTPDQYAAFRDIPIEKLSHEERLNFANYGIEQYRKKADIAKLYRSLKTILHILSELELVKDEPKQENRMVEPHRTPGTATEAEVKNN